MSKKSSIIRNVNISNLSGMTLINDGTPLNVEDTKVIDFSNLEYQSNLTTKHTSEDDLAEYEEQAAQEEYERKIRDDYKDEMTQEILELYGEDYTRWVSTNTDNIQEQIGNVASALKKLVATVVKDNQLTSQPEIMSEPERKQLISLLKAMIEELEAPFIDRGRIKSLGIWITKIAKKAFEKKASEAVDSALNIAGSELLNLSEKLTTTENTENLTSFF